MKYGPYKLGFFKRSTSDQSGFCPGLSVVGGDLARLPQADQDGDGIPDFKDNCPTVANKDQVDADQDGWGDVCHDPCDDTPLDPSCSLPPDFDQDGVDNIVDNCPEVANPDQKDSDGDGVGDACQTTTTTCPAGQMLVAGQCMADQDGDGVENSKDNCPAVANSDQKDTDGDGKGDGCDEDMDGDGVLNDVDNCPNHPNSITIAGGKVYQKDFDNDGIGNPCDLDADGDGILNESDPENCIFLGDQIICAEGGPLNDFGDDCPLTVPQHPGEGEVCEGV